MAANDKTQSLRRGSKYAVNAAVVIMIALGQIARYENSLQDASSNWLVRGTSLILKVLSPAIISFYGVKKRSLDNLGGGLAFIVGLLHIIASCSFSYSLVAFFMLGSQLSKWKSGTKQTFEAIEDTGVTRNWRQVFCNGAASSIASVAYILFSDNLYYKKYFALVALSSISCCCGDTFASEFGSVVDSNPRLVTTFRRVPRGTNGGVSPAGTMASAVGGLVVGLVFYITQQWTLDSDFSLSLILITSCSGGLFGSLVDSLLGATLQYSGYNTTTGRISHSPPHHSTATTGEVEIKHISGRDILTNNQVNLLSSSLTGILVPLILLYVVN